MNTIVKSIAAPRQRNPAIERLIEMEISRRLSAKYGMISSSQIGKYTLSDGNYPPEDVVSKIRSEVLVDVTRDELKNEAAYRISLVMKDTTTQMNLLMWLVAAKGKKAKDVALAHQLIDWITATRETCRKLINEESFSEDRHWPPVPDGAVEFMKRF